MKQFLLAAMLIAIPVAVFTAVEMWVLPGSTAASGSASLDPLGDLSRYETIVSDTQGLAESGDFIAAETRISEFETKWDDEASALRQKSPAAWGNVDAAADDTFAALRARDIDPAAVDQALATLSATLADPTGSGSSGGVQLVSGIAVTDANGHAIPCEAMLDDLRAALSDGAVATADTAEATDLQAKAIERCNADDDTHSDQLAAQALALASN